VSGQAIDQFTFAPDDPNYGTMFWDLYSKNGIEVASGLYIYLVEYQGSSRWGTSRSCGNQHRGVGHSPTTPATPPGMRVRTGRFRKWLVIQLSEEAGADQSMHWEAQRLLP